jgi:hypothetical protein
MFREKYEDYPTGGTTEGITGESTNSGMGIRDSGLALSGLDNN